MPLVRVTRLKVHRRENKRIVTYKAGDSFNASPQEVKAFADRLQVIHRFSVERPSVQAPDKAGPEKSKPPAEPNVTKSTNGSGQAVDTDDDVATGEMTLAQLKAMADSLGVEYPARVKKSELQELVDKTIGSM